ncbi:putative DNA-binding protein [Aedoeadaptatus ivorii]|uniref:UPF0122 protein NCTC13079_00872 n=1 Tax=Aedoeadaptatus ivorii TaxID=54006 RepID=A0A448V1K2_9FIRM|nr:sigma factor-like helix-turn-helix DNA-binding protein [Peptoniphilus ivorii]MDQ0507883.1 putative DNA-binding protein YlxM (UPF0122 family) [Peptoniphilus ivorii]VEJ35709.1 putative DNA-binding protein [Peptoniphilus ivorii]
MDKTIRMNVLLDLYERLLSNRQRQVMDLHYREDYSLNEIAEIVGISKQAVSENIKRAEAALRSYEEILQLARKMKAREENIEGMRSDLERLEEFSEDPTFLMILRSIRSRLEKEGYYDI